MKILTKEEEQEHYNATLRGGFVGIVSGLGLGLAGVYLGSRRTHVVRSLTLQMKAFLVTSAGTFGSIIGADQASRAYELRRNPVDQSYLERETARHQAATAGKTFTERGLDWARRERYKIVFGSWIAGMVASFSLVNRDKYLTGQQKIVQARVYAQFITLGVLIASAALEIADRKRQEGSSADPSSGYSVGADKEDRSATDLWKDMVVAEEKRLESQKEEESRLRKEIHESHSHSHGHGHGAHHQNGKKNGSSAKEAKAEHEHEHQDKDKDKDKDKQ